MIVSTFHSHGLKYCTNRDAESIKSSSINVSNWVHNRRILCESHRFLNRCYEDYHNNAHSRYLINEHFFLPPISFSPCWDWQTRIQNIRWQWHCIWDTGLVICFKLNSILIEAFFSLLAIFPHHLVTLQMARKILSALSNHIFVTFFFLLNCISILLIRIRRMHLFSSFALFFLARSFSFHFNLLSFVDFFYGRNENRCDPGRFW